ncbi:enoyl-CoA hydratase/isomerase family protein [Micromonospora sp. NPDC005163]
MRELVHRNESPRAVVLTLDRPEKRNALNADLSDALAEAVLACAETPLPLVIRSEAPGMFVAGADVAQLRARTVGENLERRNSRLFQLVADHPWPTVALVDGAALGGGCELALACDLRVSTPDAWWGLPEVRLGIVPSAGGLTRLAELVGRGCAHDLVFSGRRIRGSEAARIGLVQRLADGSLDETLDALLADLAPASPFAVRLAKEAMRVTGDRHRLVDAAAQALCIAQPDTQARLAAMLQKRSRS